MERADRLKLSLWRGFGARTSFMRTPPPPGSRPWPESNRTTYMQFRSIFYLNRGKTSLCATASTSTSLPPVTPQRGLLRTKLGSSCQQTPAAQGGRRRPKIMPVVVLNASAPELTAARRLQRYLAQISGDVPLRSGSSHGASHFAVGYFATLAAGVDVATLDGLGDDDFVLSSNRSAALRAGSVALSGGLTAPRGAIYAVFDYLRLLGCEWYAIDEVKVPSTLPSPLPMVDKVHRVHPHSRHGSMASCAQPGLVRAVGRLEPGSAD